MPFISKCESVYSGMSDLTSIGWKDKNEVEHYPPENISDPSDKLSYLLH